MSNNMPTNKVFHSPYKSDIEQRLAMGQSPRAISKWLQTRGEDISHATINKYKKEFFNVEAEASKVIKEEQKKFEEKLPKEQNVEDLEETQRKLMETEMNLHIGKVRSVNHIAVLYDNIHDMRVYLSKLQNYEPVVAAHAAKGLYAEIRATIESLEKIKEREGADDDSSVAKLLSGLKKQKKEAARIAEQGRNEQS